MNFVISIRLRIGIYIKFWHKGFFRLFIMLKYKQVKLYINAETRKSMKVFGKNEEEKILL